MYTKEDLAQYPYLSHVLDQTDRKDLFEPLTGALTRSVFISYARFLIEQGRAFTVCMVDLDNFKFINDNYGHHAGDVILKQVAEDLMAFLGRDGVVGRFGGDEILFLSLTAIDYPAKKNLLAKLYAGDTVLRKNIPVENVQPFVTATTGCASFPEDAKNYEELFHLVDKTLYRGKTKGRNCYIIYVPEKHRDLEIQKIARHGICTLFQQMIRELELVPGLDNKLHSVMPLLLGELHITDLYIVSKEGMIRPLLHPAPPSDVHDLPRLLSDDLCAGGSLDIVRAHCPLFYSFLESREMETFLVVRVGLDMDIFGYLVLAEPRTKRIWQEEERAVLYFLAKFVACHIRIHGEPLQ